MERGKANGGHGHVCPPEDGVSFARRTVPRGAATGCGSGYVAACPSACRATWRVLSRPSPPRGRRTATPRGLGSARSALRHIRRGHASDVEQMRGKLERQRSDWTTRRQPAAAIRPRQRCLGSLPAARASQPAGSPGFDMAGKTGTANIAIDGHYSDSAYVASFIGMVPTDHPRLVVAVVVNQPHGSIYGGSAGRRASLRSGARRNSEVRHSPPDDLLESRRGHYSNSSTSRFLANLSPLTWALRALRASTLPNVSTAGIAHDLALVAGSGGGAASDLRGVPVVRAATGAWHRSARDLLSRGAASIRVGRGTAHAYPCRDGAAACEWPGVAARPCAARGPEPPPRRPRPPAPDRPRARPSR